MKLHPQYRHGVVKHYDALPHRPKELLNNITNRVNRRFADDTTLFEVLSYIWSMHCGNARQVFDA